MNARPPGFEPDRIVVMKVALSGPNYRVLPPQLSFMERLLDRARTAPGVQAVGITSAAQVGLVVVEGAPRWPAGQEPQTVYRTASAGYFRVLGVRLVKGRWLGDDEPAESVMVNEAFVRRVFGNEDPLGKRVRIPRQPPSYAAIVGVAGDLKSSKLDADPEPEIYIPYRQSPSLRLMNVVMKTSADPLPTGGTVRKLLAAIDPSQPIYGIQTMEDTLAESVA
ncbi:MAG TPA: ABC transporter permease, partial [Bryobacteraceae bacterium]